MLLLNFSQRPVEFSYFFCQLAVPGALKLHLCVTYVREEEEEDAAAASVAVTDTTVSPIYLYYYSKGMAT